MQPRRSRIKAAARALFPRGGYSWLSMPRSGYDYAREVGDGLSSPVIVAPIRWIQRSFTAAPVRLRRFESGDELSNVDRSHPLLQLLNQPNDYYSGATMFKGLLASWELDGNAYELIQHNETGKPIARWYAPHSLIEAHREEGSPNFVDYYKYQPGDGSTIHIAPIGHDRRGVAGLEAGWSVLHYRDGIDPDNPMQGLSGFKSLLREVFTDDEAANFTASLLRNMGVPGLVVSPKDDGGGLAPIGDEDVKETKQQFKKATTGDSRGEPIIMSGPTNIQTIGFNPQQMNLKDIRRVPEERCTAVIGVPAIVCGLGAGLDRSTFSNMAEAKDSAWEDKIMPTQRDFAETIALQLLPQFESNPESFQIDFDNSNVRALQDDEDKIATRYTGLVNGGIATVAEAREKVGLPVEDMHRVFHLPINIIEVPEGKTMDESLGGVAAEPIKSEQKKNLSSRARQRLIASLVADQRSLERAFATRLQKRFEQLGSEAAKIWRDIAPPETSSLEHEAGKASDADRARQQQQAARSILSAAQLAAAGKLLDKLDITNFQTSIIGTEYARQYTLVAQTTIETLGSTLGLSINAPDTVAEQIAREGGRRLGLVYLEDQTKAAVYQTVADGIAQGLGNNAIAAQLQSSVAAGGMGRNVEARAMRIARTETLHAQRTACIATYEGSGAYSTVIAYDDLIGHGDDDCVERNGTEFTFSAAEVEAENEHPHGTLGFAPGEAV